MRWLKRLIREAVRGELAEQEMRNLGHQQTAFAERQVVIAKAEQEAMVKWLAEVISKQAGA